MAVPPRTPREIQQRLGYPSTADRLIRSMRFGVGLLHERGPQLLGSARRAAAAEGEPRVKRQLLAAWRCRDRQKVIDHDARPLAIEEEPQAIAAGGISRRIGGKEVGDEVMPLSDHRQRRHEPAVSHATLEQVLCSEAEVAHNGEVTWHARPRQLGRGAATAKGHLATVRP